MPLSEPWAPYEPDAKTPWTLRRVVHLHRRAAFAGAWDELQRDLRDGPAAAVDRLLAGTANAHAAPDFSVTAGLIADAAVATGKIGRLKAAWFCRMLLGPDPLGEKLTLLWHDHFATANSKVEDAGLMQQQNDTFRKYARCRFADLLDASVREPALLRYLDAPSNRKGHANENLARELMELFTLGVGNFSEADVKDAARALTGWTVEDRRFAQAAERHDTTTKTVLGQTGAWAGDDLVALLSKHPATADRVAAKLCQQFFGEKAITPQAIAALGAKLRECDLDVGLTVGTVLKSRLFFADANLGNRVLCPVEFVVGAVRALELFDPAPSTLALADWCARIGQDLFEPPNVGGWPGGRAWIHTRSLVARQNYAAALVTGPDAGRPAAYEATALPARYGFGSTPHAVLNFYQRLLFGTEPTAEVQRRFAGANGPGLIERLLASAEGQLG